MGNYAIQVSNLSKRYSIGQVLDSNATIVESLSQLFIKPVQRLRRLVKGDQSAASDLDESFWALQDVSFDVMHGEVVGVIGHNGAGKSTLLKLLSRITYPTRGRIALYGRTGSLLEVGTGFHPELTGRENLYMNAAILGMSKYTTDSKFDEIVAFAGVERFIDTPVKHYSSGMRLRLAFSVSAHLEPEILIIDEVLAVGDAEFQQKCLGKMNESAQEGRTVIFVSHNLPTVRELCTRAILLDKGQIVADGGVEDTLSQYLGDIKSPDAEMIWEAGIANPEVQEFAIHAVRIRDAEGKISNVLDYTQSYTLEIEYVIHEKLPRLRVGFAVRTANQITAFVSYDSDNPAWQSERQAGRHISHCCIPGNLLAPGKYFIDINAGISGRKNLANIRNVLSLELIETSRSNLNEKGQRYGILRPRFDWTVEARTGRLET